jgi:putative DNA primase/helicase
MISAQDLAYRLNLKHYRNSWRGDCPACGYKGAFAASGGKRGPLLWCASGCSQDQLIEAVNHVSGGSWEPPAADAAKAAETRQRKQESALRLWRGSVPAVGTIVERYLAARGLPGLAASPALRFRADAPHPEGGRLPAMIALVTDRNDQPIGIHRTYLRADGSGKANAEPQRAGLGPVWAGAVRLDPVGPEIVVGEGIESSASAGCLLSRPAWAAISAGNLAQGLVLPAEVRRVVVAADNDDAGRDAARAAWFEWRAEGREVQISYPDREGFDFNDVLLTRIAREAAYA